MALLLRGVFGSLRNNTISTPSVFAPITNTPYREFASKRKKKMMRSTKKKKMAADHPNRMPRWRFSDYLEKKSPDVTYWDAECEGWKFDAAMLLERSPRLVPEDYEPSWAVEWRQFQDELDLRRKKQVPLEWLETRRSKMEEAAKVFRPNPRITDADRTNDTKSLHRALNRPLYLIVKKHGSETWSLPSAEWAKNETMRETAERMAKQHYGFDLTQHLLGNAPVAHLENGKTKTFFFHNLWLGGNVILKDNKNLKDFAWVTQAEFPAYGIGKDVIELTDQILWAG